jgi:hypothetical protein
LTQNVSASAPTETSR